MELLELIITVLALNTDALADGLAGLALPVVVTFIGIVAVVFLASGRAAQLAGFLAVAAIVVMLITTPEVITNVGQWLGGLLT